MITDDQLPKRFREIITDELDIYSQDKQIKQKSKIPDTTEIPIEDPNEWLKIDKVICVFVDMKNSTRLSAEPMGKYVVGPYRLFTGTAVRLFSRFEAPYVDVRGDGAFALFNKDQAHRALCAAVTFKTFACEEFLPKVKAKTDANVGSHIGIDALAVYVRKLGFKRHAGRSDRQNEVWAGKPVNMAAKLAAFSDHNQLVVSSRYHRMLTDERALKSCGCRHPEGKKTNLWAEVDVEAKKQFDFNKAYRLDVNWCPEHGRSYCEGLLRADNE